MRERVEEQRREELFEKIVDTLGEMPDSLRDVFALSHYRGLSVSEIAVELGRTEEEVRCLLEKANEFFSEQLSSQSATNVASECVCCS